MPPPSARSSFRPGLELLENRLTPAVTTTGVVQGVLTITLDAASGPNAVTINEFNAVGAFTVAGTGLVATTFTGVVSIVIHDLNVSGAVDLITYNGNGVAGDAADTRLTGFLVVNNLNGANLNVQIGASFGLDDITILGGIIVNNPTPANINLVVGAFGGARANLGSLTVVSNGAFIPATAGLIGAGSALIDAQITSFVSLVSLNQQSFPGASAFTAVGLQIGGFFAYQGGPGSDFLTLGGPGAQVAIDGNLAIDLGGNNNAAFADVANLNQVIIRGDALLLGGAGAQNFNLGDNFGFVNSIGGNLTLNMGGGGATFNPDVFFFDGALGGNLMHQGSGPEIFVLNGNGVLGGGEEGPPPRATTTSIGGYVSYNNPGDLGGSLVLLAAGFGGLPNGGTVAIGDFLSVLTGSAADLVALGYVTVGQNFALATGGGNDVVNINSAILHGLVFGDLGSGNDFLSFDGRTPTGLPFVDGLPTIVNGLVNLALGSEADTTFLGDGFNNADRTIWSAPGGTIQGQDPLGGNLFQPAAELTFDLEAAAPNLSA